MTIGLQLLSAVIASGSRSAVREMQAEFFLPEELPFYEYFTGFYRRHGVLPTTQVMAEGGYNLPPAGSPFAYYLERIRDRSIYQVAMEHYPRLGEALSRRDMAAAIERARIIAQAGSRVRAATDVIAIQEAFGLVMEDYERAYQDRLAGAGPRGVTLGWDPLDEVTMGAQAGEVVTLVARPNVGKSWLMLYLAERAWAAGRPCLFVTMEMQLLQVARRFLSLSTGINPDYIRRGDLSWFGEGIVHEAINRVADRPPFHIVAGNLRKSVGAVDAILQEFEPDAIYIDASYLMDPDGAKPKGRALWESLADVQKDIRSMALARRRPIFQSVQYNRRQKKGEGQDLDNMGGTDVVAQISSIVIGATPGDAPNENATRKLAMTKNREGRKVELEIDFLFEPMNFGFRRMLGDEAGAATEDEWGEAA